MRRISLTRRLIAVVVLSQLLLAGGLLLVGVWYTARQLHAAFDTALRGRAIDVAALVRYREVGGGLLFDPTLLPPPSDPRHPDLFQIVGISRLGRTPIAASSAPPPNLLAGARSGFANVSVARVPYRALVLRDLPVLDTEVGIEGPPSRLDVVYASPLLAFNRRVAAVVWTVAIASLLLLLLAVGFAAWYIRRGLAPLRALAGAAGGVSARHWDFHPPPAARGVAELAPLASALERMLAGLRAAFRRQRDFSPAAAPELKTPVAILKSSLQTLLQREREPAEYRAAARRSLEDVERLEALLARMLRLARAEQYLAEPAARRAAEPVALALTCEAALDRLRPMAESQGMRLEFRGAAALAARADAEDLELVWVNLVENAIRHSPAGAAIVVAAAPAPGDPGSVVVTVADSGSGIAAGDLPHLFERFHRSDPSRARQTGGYGLGLPICQALIEACGGMIAIASELGRGTTVTVTLPGAGPPAATEEPQGAAEADAKMRTAPS